MMTDEQKIEQIEEFRTKALSKKRFLGIWIFLVIVTVLGLTVFLADRMGDEGFPAIMLLWILGALSVTGLGMAIHNLKGDYSEEIKCYLVETAAEGMFDSFSYRPEEGFLVDDLSNADMMKIRACKTDDMMVGEYNDVTFVHGDVTINAESESLGEPFYGTWTVYSFLKPFTSDLQVTTAEMLSHSRVNRTFFTKKDEKRHLFLTGDTEFDDLFACSGQDEQEAMTLLTPAVRKRLIRIYQDTGLPMIIGWKDKELHFITGNALAPFGYEPEATLDYEAMLAETRRKLYLIRRVIEELIMSRSVFSEYALEEYSMPVDTEHEEGLRRQ